MERIMVIGSGGAGKSMFSRQLGEKLGIEVCHLDALFWKANWIPTEREEIAAAQKELVTYEKWVIDGNYSGTWDIRLGKADTVIFLDMPRALCLYRVVKRRVQYHNKTRPDMGSGCNERLDAEFLKWVWDFPKKQKPILMEKIRQLPDSIKVHILQSPREVREFLDKA